MVSALGLEPRTYRLKVSFRGISDVSKSVHPVNRKPLKKSELTVNEMGCVLHRVTSEASASLLPQRYPGYPRIAG